MRIIDEIRSAVDGAVDLVHRTLASRKATGALAAFVAALHAGRPDLAVAAVVAFLAAEGYVDSKRA